MDIVGAKLDSVRRDLFVGCGAGKRRCRIVVGKAVRAGTGVLEYFGVVYWP